MASICESPKMSKETDDSENVPPLSLSGATCPAPPAQNQHVVGKPQLSALQSALTPILKYLNIGNRNTSHVTTNSQHKSSTEDKAEGCRDIVQNENLPEVTLLDGTFDSTMNQCNLPNACTPVVLKSKSMNFYDKNLNSPFPWIYSETLPEVSYINDTCDSTMISPPTLHLDNVSFAGQNEMDKTNTNLPSKNSYLCTKREASILETDNCTPAKRPLLESCEINSANMSKTEIKQSLANIPVTVDVNLAQSISSGSGVTQDISTNSTLDSSQSTPVTAAFPNNTTQDLGTSNAADQSDVSRSLGENSKNATFEVSPGEKSNSISDIPLRQNSGTAETSNDTFSVQASSAQNQTMEIASSPQNKTIEIATSVKSPAKPENQSTNVNHKQNSSAFPIASNNNSSDSKSSQNYEAQNQTFENNSLQKFCASTITTVVHASGSSSSLQNTFESKPEGNQSSAEPVIPEMSSEPEQTAVSEKSENRLRTFNATENAAAEETSTTEAKACLNGVNHLSESINHNFERRTSGTFNLDSSLDFKTDNMVTSTPMITAKAFNFIEEKEHGTAAQKKLYGGPSKLAGSASVEVPSNIVCNQKTFLPAVRTNVPSLKAPSLLSKFKPTSLLPKRPEIATADRPLSASNESSKTAAQSSQQVTSSKLPASYNLRSTAAGASGLKQPGFGLRKPAVSGIPSSLQGARGGLKPPTTKCSSAVVPGSGKPPTGPSNLTKTVPAKRQPLPAAKKKRTDKGEEATTAPDTTSRAKTLKPPHRALLSKPLKQVPLSLNNETHCESTSGFEGAAAGVINSNEKQKCLDCEASHRLIKDLEAQLREKDEEIRVLKEGLAQWKGPKP